MTTALELAWDVAYQHHTLWATGHDPYNTHKTN